MQRIARIVLMATSLLTAGASAVAGAAALFGQPDASEAEDGQPSVADQPDEGTEAETADDLAPAPDDGGDCPGDGIAVDTPEEIAEFASYASDELYVLDDDVDCADDEFGDTGYSLPGETPFRSPGILPLLAAGAGPEAREDQAPSRMVVRSTGGRAVRDAEAPWQVQIFQPWTLAQLNSWGVTTGGKALWEYQHLCGATLVADNWALTASHCLPPSAATTGYRVRLAAETIHTDSPFTYRIDRIVQFNPNARPAANGVWRIDDISLIRFTDDRGVGRPSAAQARPIGIDRSATLPDDMEVYATGWGRLSNRSANPASTMMKVQLRVVANARCAQGPWGPSFVHDRVICAAAPGRQTCQGDSGGPLVNTIGTPRLVGIVSWNNADCIGDVGRQGIYTRVAAYADWIERTIRQ